MRLFLVFAAAFAPLLSAAPAGAKRHQDFRAEARAAYERKDYAAARAATEAARRLRPDSPRYLYNLAAFAALTQDAPAAIEYLQQLAALGVSMPVERDPDFASLQGTAPFLRVLQQLAANRAPRGEVQELAELPGRTGIIEGLAYRARTGDLYFSDVHHRGIWRRDRAGAIQRFSAEDEDVLGVFGLALDETRQVLWAAMSAVPEMAGYTAELKDRAGLAEFDLGTSALRRVIPVPLEGREHGLGDLLVTADGTVYTTDSKAPVIWKLALGADDFEKLVDSPLFTSLQGIVAWQREIIVADYANGLFAIDPNSGAIRALNPPAGTTLLGLDGLLALPDGIVATQNGVEPQRVVKITLTPRAEGIASVTVLAAALPQLQDLSLISLVDGVPTFIAGSGWEGFDPAKSPQPAAHTVRLLQILPP
jgi:sugar lactone lactonase YvrE